MTALRELLGELAGLFVEDRLFALAIAGCLLLVFAVSVTNVVPPPARGGLLFALLAVTLVASVTRGAHTS